LLTEGENAPLQPDQIRLLIGDTPETEKAVIRQSLADGTIKIIVGTHALIEGPVAFQHLQLAVIDEQHRFGVAQRAALRLKGDNPHLLVMTATPIPRSLALTVYGDLDLSIMDEMPKGRLPIETHLLPPLERERAYRLIRKQVELGYQAFIIYPLVEQGEDSDENNAAVQEYERLQSEIFLNFPLGLMHGRLKPEEKDAVMNEFRSGNIKVMVSTSVVEVGVDVPNATVMLIESANRFGLSQLHQFRGRVGRGEAQSYCLLIPDSDTSLDNERLAVMEETNDGFVLAERDLQQRGPGDFLGTRQSGYADLRMAKLTDVHLIENARRHALQVFETDPDLQDPDNRMLANALSDFWGNGKGDVS
jgi:ATP-dependent DNA helicase RecG